MHHEIRQEPDLGRVLWLTDGHTDVAASLDVGIRLVHLSVHGGENLYYRQPSDLSDGICTDKGWRLFGGHRFWLAPESTDTYWPDQLPVDYTLDDNGVTLTQQSDPWLRVQKSLQLTFMPDGSLAVCRRLVNQRDEALTGALWGINSLRGGIGEMGFANPGGDPCVPHRGVQLWGNTNLGDPRIQFEQERVVTRQMDIPAYFKIGLYSSAGHIHHENLGQAFDISIPVIPREQCADGGCNLEIYQNARFMELETVGPAVTLAPGESAELHEVWRVSRLG